MSEQDPPPSLRLRIFNGDLAFLDRLRRRGSDGWTLLALPVLAIAVPVLFSLIDGNFSQPNIGGLISHDTAVYLHTSKWGGGTVPSGEVSLLRDLPTLLVFAILMVTPFLMYRQWSGIAVFLDEMERRGVLSFPNGRAAVAEKIARCNSYFTRAASFNAYAMLAAVGSVMLVTVAQRHDGVYSALSAGPAGVAIDYDHWWASSTSAPVNAVVYVIIGSLGIYVAFLQEMYGGRTVLLLWQLRRDVRYGADPDNIDGSYGWSEIQGILTATWISILLDGVGFALISLSLSHNKALYLLPLLGQWLITAPLYIGLPIFLTRKNIRSFQRDEIARLGALYEASNDLAQRGAIADRLDRVRKIRVLPFVGKTGQVVALVGFVSSLVTVVQIMRLIY
jgi:hypothetical protein